MASPEDIPRILLDAARLLGEGEIVVFGSAALAFWLADAPTTRDIDIWCEPEDRGAIIEALMGELSWYQERHGEYVEVWRPETFAAPKNWRVRSKQLFEDEVPKVTLILPHPHDLLFAKLERWEEADRRHAAAIEAEFPLNRQLAEQLDTQMPHRLGVIADQQRVAAYSTHYDSWVAKY